MKIDTPLNTLALKWPKKELFCSSEMKFFYFPHFQMPEFSRLNLDIFVRDVIPIKSQLLSILKMNFFSPAGVTNTTTTNTSSNESDKKKNCFVVRPKIANNFINNFTLQPKRKANTSGLILARSIPSVNGTSVEIKFTSFT